MGLAEFSLRRQEETQAAFNAVAARYRDAEARGQIETTVPDAPAKKPEGRPTPADFKADPKMIEAGRIIYKNTGGQAYPGQKRMGYAEYFGPFAYGIQRNVQLQYRDGVFTNGATALLSPRWLREDMSNDDEAMGEVALSFVRSANENLFATAAMIGQAMRSDPEKAQEMYRAASTLFAGYDPVDEVNAGVLYRSIVGDPTNLLSSGAILAKTFEKTGATAVLKAAQKSGLLAKVLPFYAANATESAFALAITNAYRRKADVEAKAPGATGNTAGTVTKDLLTGAAFGTGISGLASGAGAAAGYVSKKLFGIQAAAEVANEVLGTKAADAPDVPAKAAEAPGSPETAGTTKDTGEAPKAAGEAPAAPEEALAPSPEEADAISGAFHAQADHVRDVAQGLREELDALGMADVRLDLYDEMTGPDGMAVDGRSSDGGMLIELALDSEEEAIGGVLGALHHEHAHALRTRGLVSDADFRIVVDRARALAKTVQYHGGIPLPKLGEAARAAGLKGEALDEELFAEYIQRYAAGFLEEDEMTHPVYTRIAQFVEAVRNYLRGQGFRTAADVREAVTSGRLAQGMPRPEGVPAWTYTPRKKTAGVPSGDGEGVSAPLTGGATTPLASDTLPSTPDKGFGPGEAQKMETGTEGTTEKTASPGAQAYAVAKLRVSQSYIRRLYQMAGGTSRNAKRAAEALAENAKAWSEDAATVLDRISKLPDESRAAVLRREIDTLERMERAVAVGDDAAAKEALARVTETVTAAEENAAAVAAGTAPVRPEPEAPGKVYRPGEAAIRDPKTIDDGAPADEGMFSRRVTPEQDAKYLAAADAGDEASAQRMVASAAKSLGLVEAYHGGTFDKDVDPVFSVNEQGAHFGTYAAAEHRIGTFTQDNLIANAVFDKDENGRWHYSTDSFDSYDTNEEGFASKADATADLEDVVFNQMNVDDIEAKVEAVYLELGRSKLVKDQGKDWSSAVELAKQEGYTSLHYRNAVEDKNSVSYVVFDPSQIKSADAITRDDAGNVIPLSKRFDPQSDDTRYSYRQNYRTQAPAPGPYPGFEFLNERTDDPAVLNYDSIIEKGLQPFLALFLDEKMGAELRQKFQSRTLGGKLSAAQAARAMDEDLPGVLTRFVKAMGGEMPRNPARLLELNALADYSVAYARQAQQKWFDDPTPDNYLDANIAALMASAIPSVAYGINSNVARMLASLRFRKQSVAGLPEQVRAVRLAALVYGPEGKEGAAKVAAMFMEKTKVGKDHPYTQALKFLIDFGNAQNPRSVVRALGFLWTQGLLSAPGSMMVNVAGSAVALAHQYGDLRITEARKGVAPGTSAAWRQGLAEAATDMVALWSLAEQRLTPGAEPGPYAIKYGLRPNESNPAIDAFTSAKWREAHPDATLALDYLTSLPGKTFGATDSVAYHIGFSAHLRALAHNEASEVFARLPEADQTAKNFNEMFMHALTNPSREVSERADWLAREGTFMLPPSDIGKAFIKLRDQVPLLGTWIAPFISTPDNIMRFAFRRSVVPAILTQSFRDDILAGGERAAMAKGRLVLGSALFTTAAYLAKDGFISGAGPRDPGDRELWRSAGNEPMSFSFSKGGPRYSFNGLDPFALFLGLSADAVEVYRAMAALDSGDDPDLEALIPMLVFSNVNLLMNRSYVSSAGGFFAATSDPEGRSGAWAKRMIGSMLPGVVAAVARGTSPELRECENMVDVLKERIPWLRQQVGIRRDMFGRKITPAKDTWLEVMTPFARRGQEGVEPFDRALWNDGNPIRLDGVRRRESFHGVNIDLYDYRGAHSRYLELLGSIEIGGKTIRQTLNDAVTGKELIDNRTWEQLTPGPKGGQEEYVRNRYEQYKAAARESLLKENTALAAEVEKRRLEAGNAMFREEP